MKSTMTQLLERGMERGREEGMEKGVEKVAKAMLVEGDPISKITKVTGLSGKELGKLKSEIDQD